MKRTIELDPSLGLPPGTKAEHYATMFRMFENSVEAVEMISFTAPVEGFSEHVTGTFLWSLEEK